MVGGVKIKKQRFFPRLGDFRDKFPIDENTIFIYKDTIFTNNEMPYDIVHHELEHLRDQQEVGADLWINKYLNNKDFRLKAELRAYRYQLKEVKKMNDRTELMNITTECIKNISSHLYGNMISYRKAEQLLK